MTVKRRRDSASNSPTAWHYDGQADLTFRWQRGATHMQVYQGNQLGGPAAQRVLAQVPVPSGGWLDQGEVASHARAWLTSAENRCAACGSRLRRTERRHAS